MKPAAYEELFELLDVSQLSDDQQELILAAADGTEELSAYLSGETVPSRDEPEPIEISAPRVSYLEEIAVEGFRGIGERSRLQLQPGPGLTLVVGRNGSGKSSFAEGLEVLLTGTTLRWEERTKVWRDGWRNLHHDGTTTVSARFREDGSPTPLQVTRSWPPAAKLDDAETPEVSGSAADWEALGWDVALDRFRPLLSYNELETMFSSRASRLYDALSAILGLEEFDGVLATLRDARLAREKSTRQERTDREALRAQIAESDDPRGEQLHQLLDKRAPDLDAVSVTAGTERDAENPTIRGLTRITTPDAETVTAAVSELGDASTEAEALRRTDAGAMDALATLLETGVSYHREHVSEDPADCPLCGASGAIDAMWAVRTDALAALDEWDEALATDGDAIATLRDAGLLLGDEVLNAREAAQAAERRLAAAWRPVQEATLAWVSVARRAAADRAIVERLKDAEKSMTTALGKLRAGRLAPVVDGAQANWSLLRHESNVALGNIALAGKGSQRYATFDVAIDGSDASALGVMSQGELSALAISVFLPRALLPGSPFGFVVIDDPVQSMDPAKVDGLARVLAGAAAHRQVIVFTHDARLPEAVRRLEIPARIMRVQRQAKSRLSVVADLPPSERYLKEAFALSKGENLSPAVRDVVIPTFCRSAIEAACADRIRRRRIAGGTSHAEVDEDLDKLTSLHTWLAAALDLNTAQGHEVTRAVRNMGGDGAVKAVILARRGAHEPIPDLDLGALTRDTERLVRVLERA